MIVGWIQKGGSDAAIASRVILALLVPCFAAGFYAGASTASMLSDCYSGIAAEGKCEVQEVDPTPTALGRGIGRTFRDTSLIADTSTEARLRAVLLQVDSLLVIISSKGETSHERIK